MLRMSRTIHSVGACALCLSFLLAIPARGDEQKFDYPDARRGDQVDEYHGTKVADPYRWLEELDSPEKRAWIEAQNKLTFGFLEDIPERDRIRSRLKELWNYERYGIPNKEGGKYFYFKNNGLQNQSVLYVVDKLDGEPRVLIDPNKWSDDGTISLSGYEVSPDGKHVAYGISRSGSDWQEWKLRDVETAEDLDDHLKWIKFSGASWTEDGKGFFYSRYAEPEEGTKMTDTNYYQKLYYHKVGEPQAKDTLVYERKDKKEWGFNGHVTDDGRYLIINVRLGTDPRNLVFYRDLEDDRNEVVELISEFESSYSFIDNDGTTFWFRTDHEAPRGRVIAIDVTEPDRADWKEVIPQRLAVLRGINTVGGHFVVHYLDDASSRVRVFDLKGKEVREVDLPGIGSVSGFGGRRDETETFYSFESFTMPDTIYRYDMKSGESKVFRKADVKFNPDEFTTRQIMCRSKDGTQVPIFITHKKSVNRSDDNPTLLYGYGGFNIAIMPRFSVSNLVWMEMGGIYAQASIRGGGEYGEDWHQAGTKLQKQNVFDDFIAAAEQLVDYRYTNPDKLAIMGGSNGGLLVGACVNQRPDLFGAALPAVGVMDMLRFHKFTIGWAWVSDYGSSEDPEEFSALYAYSPLHNIKKGTKYPATMITTADHDDRVVPAHSFKYAAALQHAQAGDDPILIRIQTKAGHGAGKPVSMIIDEVADKWAFLVKTLDMKPSW